MLRSNIEPVLFKDKIATLILARVDFYDLQGQRCILFFKAANNEDGAYYTETWEVPSTTLENWGTDDTILLQALADEKGFVLI